MEELNKNNDRTESSSVENTTPYDTQDSEIVDLYLRLFDTLSTETGA